MQDFALSRRNMVDGQLRPNAVTHPGVLAAMGQIPREAFLPSSLRAVAYVDEALPLPGGRSVLAPLVLARLIQALQPRTSDKALIVGAGAGYGAAILATMTDKAVALESDPALLAHARVALPGVAGARVTVVEGALAAGWKSGAPYDAILIEGEIADLPSALTDQLADGGRLVAVQARADGSTAACLALRTGNSVSQRLLFDATAGRLPGLDRTPKFEFAA